MTITVWPQANTPKHIWQVAANEIFRFGDNRLGTVFGVKSPSSTSPIPWNHLVDLVSFEAMHFDSLPHDMPEVIYSLGDQWQLRLGGQEAECSFIKPPLPGSVISTSQGLSLVARGLSGLVYFGLLGDQAGKLHPPPASEHAIFDTWSLLARANPNANFELTQLDFDAARGARIGA